LIINKKMQKKMTTKNMTTKNLVNLQNGLLTLNEWIFYNNSVCSIRELSTSRLLLASEGDSSGSDASTWISDADGLTDHQLYSPEYPSNLHNKPVDEIPDRYRNEYKSLLVGMMKASVEDREKVNKLKERFDEFDKADPKPDSLPEKSESDSSTSSSSEATETDNISKLVNLDSPGENSGNQENSGKDKLTEENKRKWDEFCESKDESESSSESEPQAKRFKQDTSDVSVDDSRPQFADVVEGGKVYIKEDFENSSPTTSDQGDLPSGNNDPGETGTQGGTSDQGGSGGQGGKYFKQDSRDITSDGEMPSLQDLDGGE
jgi:hypothetical protein